MNPYRAYSAADNHVNADDKPKILLKVYQSMLDKIDIVKVAIEKKNFEKKYDELTKLTTALDILDSSLDMSQGEIPRNLSGLYQYLVRRLTGVHMSHDMQILEECREILSQLNEGFTGAYQKERNQKGEENRNPDPGSSSLSHLTV